MISMMLKLCTVPGAPMEIPLASQTRNLAGTDLWELNTLLPLAAMGGRMVCPGSPSHIPAGAKMMLNTPGR